jgi:hypothetical protein
VIGYSIGETGRSLQKRALKEAIKRGDMNTDKGPGVTVILTSPLFGTPVQDSGVSRIWSREVLSRHMVLDIGYASFNNSKT